MELWNHFQAEGLLKDRLKQMVQGVPKNRILSAYSIEELIKNHIGDEAIYVLFHNDVVTADASNDGSAQSVDQQWLIVVAIRNVSDKTGQAARDSAGEIVDATLQAMLGYDMEGRFTSLHQKNSPYKYTYRNGVMYFPFLFGTTITTVGIEND